jgi:serine/threonine protein kinase
LYIWGKCGEDSDEETIYEAKAVEFQSFNVIFNYYYGITNKTIEKLIDFNIKIIENGKYFKGYKEIEKLGEGHYGVAFKAGSINNMEEKHAIKKIKFDIDKERDLKELENFDIFNESNAINILKLYRIWIESHESIECLTLHISMELCEKTEELIRELQKDKNLSIDKTLTILGYYIACKIFVEILKGVNYLHTRKPQILHMDLHSGNILLKREYDSSILEGYEPPVRVKLADFGSANICEFAQKSQMIASKRDQI